MTTTATDYRRAGRLLADLIKDYGWSKNDMAERSGVSASLISKYTGGKPSRPDANKLRSIAMQFDPADAARLLSEYGLGRVAVDMLRGETDGRSDLEIKVDRIIEFLERQFGFNPNQDDGEPKGVYLNSGIGLAA